jgi:hypothetical protein
MFNKKNIIYLFEYNNVKIKIFDIYYIFHSNNNITGFNFHKLLLKYIKKINDKKILIIYFLNNIKKISISNINDFNNKINNNINLRTYIEEYSIINKKIDFIINDFLIYSKDIFIIIEKYKILFYNHEVNLVKEIIVNDIIINICKSKKYLYIFDYNCNMYKIDKNYNYTIVKKKYNTTYSIILKNNFIATGSLKGELRIYNLEKKCIFLNIYKKSFITCIFEDNNNIIIKYNNKFIRVINKYYKIIYEKKISNNINNIIIDNSKIFINNK